MTEGQIITVPEKAPQNVAKLGSILNAKLDSLAEMAPAHLRLDPIRVARLAYIAYSRTPDLQKCSPGSFFMALSDAMKFGVDPVSPHGYGYLIPRWNSKAGTHEATFMPGYKGFLHLARRTGMVRDMRANVVVEGEEFEVDLVEGRIHHKWSPDVDHSDEEKFVAAYAIAWPKDGGGFPAICVLDRAQMMKRKAAGNGKLWTAWPDRMWRKTAIRTLANGGELEMDPTFEALLAYDQALEERSTQRLVTARRDLGVNGTLSRLTGASAPAIEHVELETAELSESGEDEFVVPAEPEEKSFFDQIEDEYEESQRAKEADRG